MKRTVCLVFVMLAVQKIYNLCSILNSSNKCQIICKVGTATFHLDYLWMAAIEKVKVVVLGDSGKPIHFFTANTFLNQIMLVIHTYSYFNLLFANMSGHDTCEG